VRFVETPVFTAALRRQLDDETYRALQPRWRLPLHGRGKRGGLRLIYYWEPDQDVIYMLYLYAKNEQGDLTPGQMRVLKRLVREEFQ